MLAGVSVRRVLLSAAPLSKSTPVRFNSSMQKHNIKRVGIVGAGQMGLGIALVSARYAKVDVLLSDASQSQIQKSLAFMDKLLAKDVGKQRLTQEEADATKNRVKPVASIEDFGKGDGVDLVIEAVSENVELKKKIFASLCKILSKDSILATNTSSISISKIAASVSNPERVVGMHFFNPVPVMKLIELIPALQTSQETLQRAELFARACGKDPAISRDEPGFISNRILVPFLNEAILVLENGVATKEDIDKSFKLGMNHPMGPCELADFIGLDTCLWIMETLHRETGDSKYRPSVLLTRMVDAGYLGRKSGKGFYEYP